MTDIVFKHIYTTLVSVRQSALYPAPLLPRASRVQAGIQAHDSQIRRDYREQEESRASVQHADILIRSLKKVAGDVEGESRGWKIKFIIFVEGAGHVKTFNDNLNELNVIKEMRSAKVWFI